MFFYAGNFMSVFATHYFTLKFGAKSIITSGIIISVLTTWIFPFLMIYFNPSYIFMAILRFLTGLAQGFFIPCASFLISRWFGENEKSSAMALFTTGNQVGLAFSMFFTAELCKLDFLHGWPLAFISYGSFIRLIIASGGFSNLVVLRFLWNFISCCLDPLCYGSAS